MAMDEHGQKNMALSAIFERVDKIEILIVAQVKAMLRTDTDDN